MAKRSSPARSSSGTSRKPQGASSAPPEREPVEETNPRPDSRPIVAVAQTPALPPIHLQKLNAAIANDKLPPRDKPRLEAARERYYQWDDAGIPRRGSPRGRPEVGEGELSRAGARLLDQRKGGDASESLLVDSPEGGAGAVPGTP